MTLVKNTQTFYIQIKNKNYNNKNDNAFITFHTGNQKITAKEISKKIESVLKEIR